MTTKYVATKDNPTVIMNDLLLQDAGVTPETPDDDPLLDEAKTLGRIGSMLVKLISEYNPSLWKRLLESSEARASLVDSVDDFLKMIDRAIFREPWPNPIEARMRESEAMEILWPDFCRTYGIR